MKHIELIGGGRILRGSLGGILQASIVFSIKVHEQLDSELIRSEEIAKDLLLFVEETAGSDYAQTLESPKRFIDLFLGCITTVLTAYQHPIFHKARILHTDRTKDAYILKAQQPCLDYNAGIASILLCTEFFSAALNKPGGFDLSQEKVELSKTFRRHLINLKKGQLNGFNSFHFLKTGHELGVPWFRFSGDTFQFGYGSASRLLNSSFTDQTSWIGNRLSKNKNAALRVLQMAGLPVPDQASVSSPEHAIELAEKIGYPVVIKPIDLDGGEGVSAFLTQQDDVAHAYKESSQLSQNIVVEKHIQGKDYRLQVVDGEVQGIIERQPGGVLGDGISSISELITSQNRERKYAKDDRKFLHPILEDFECQRMLRMQNLELSSVPATGLFIQLRGAANVASGGVPSVLDIEQAHPDNVELAIRATRILRLDVAGVDLITRDIGKSCLETGGAICEVNAQPQMFTNFHRPMLEALLGSKRGHIPICLVLEDQRDGRLGHGIFNCLLQHRPAAGFVSSDGVFLGKQSFQAAPQDLFHAAQSLLVDPVLDSLVLSLPARYPDIDGWPVAATDVVVLNAERLEADVQNMEQDLLKDIDETLRPRAAFLSNSAASMARELGLFTECSIDILSFNREPKSHVAQTNLAKSVVSALLPKQ